MYTVYCVTNMRNDKVYVGQTGQHYVSDRWKKHLFLARKGVDTHFYRALRKYGPGVFVKQVLSTAETVDEVNNLERLWIILLRANDRTYGYNVTVGGEHPVHTEETKKKISQIQIGQRHSEEHKRNTSRGLMGHSVSAETRAKIAAKTKQRWADRREVMANGQSPAANAKRSASLKLAYTEGRRGSRATTSD